MITAKQLVDYAQWLFDQKAAYWYGTFGAKCSTSLYNSKRAQYPAHYTAARAAGYKRDIAAGKIVTDCVGVLKGACWSDGGQHAPKYASGGCPDKNADGMFSWCKAKGMDSGKMASLPEIPGLMLHMGGHTGVYIGGGYAIEAKGFDYDVVKSKVAGRGWTGWAKLPYVQYETVLQPIEPEPPQNPDPTVQPIPREPVIADLSQHNALKLSKNDWAKIAKNVDLLILRCGVTRTETKPLGIGIDAEFAFAAKKCQEHGIPFGVYYYGKVASAAEARLEARKAYTTASPFKPLFYAYDVEESRLTNACLQAFAEELRKLGAAKVGMYVGHNYYTKYKAAVKWFDFIWIPRYGKNTGLYDLKYKPAYPCDLHQYTSVGKLAGLADNTVDLNRLTGSKPLSWFLTKIIGGDGQCCGKRL